MENVHLQQAQAQAPAPATLPPRRHRLRSSPKMERRIIEKKRRDHMKGLFSTLFSLLPSYQTKGMLPVPEQIDEAVEYIKNLQEKIEKMNEKKEKLMLSSENKRRYRSSSCIAEETSGSSRLLSLPPPPPPPQPPKFEIHEMGPAMDVVFLTGLDENQTAFYRILRSLQEDGFEVVHASFSNSGNSMLQVAHAKTRKSLARRLKELLSEEQEGEQRRVSGDEDLESSPDLCDFNAEFIDIWGSEFQYALAELGVGKLY